jgi:hypothetical protein
MIPQGNPAESKHFRHGAASGKAVRSGKILEAAQGRRTWRRPIDPILIVETVGMGAEARAEDVALRGRERGRTRNQQDGARIHLEEIRTSSA